MDDQIGLVCAWLNADDPERPQLAEKRLHFVDRKRYPSAGAA